MRLYDNATSGNGYKVRLLLALLGADEGGFELTQYVNVSTWLQRSAERPGFIAIDSL